MPKFAYRALTADGEIVDGVLDAPSADFVGERVAGLGLIPIDGGDAAASAASRAGGGTLGPRPRPDEITVFSRDLALLLRTGVRINNALDLMASDSELGRMRPIVNKLHEAVLGGQSFAEALKARPDAFPPLYVALVGIGEQTAMLPSILEALTAERVRAEAMRRRILDALRYPGFLLVAAFGVMVFFLTFVLPQFAGVFSDMNAKPDPMLATFLALSASLRENGALYAGGAVVAALAVYLVLRSAGARALLFEQAARLPYLGTAFEHHRTILFCRNLGLLLSGGVTLSNALRILVEVMATTGAASRWSRVVDGVRRGGKLSEALADETLLPAMAVRTLRLGEETNQLPMLCGRVADYYESRLERSVDRIVGIVGPLSIIAISGVVGGLLVSVMTALLSVDQMVE
jgi:general secretion pathway protein F